MRHVMWLGLVFCVGSGVAWADEPDPEDEPEEEPAPPRIRYTPRAEIDFSDLDVAGELVKPTGALLLNRTKLGATPGGVQDLTLARAIADRGEVPSMAAFAPEGLFSEHDLPLDMGACDRLLCVDALAAPAALAAQDDVDHLAQLGFSSGLDASTWRRPPLNLVLVVDLSGSMDGEAIAAVRAAVGVVSAHLDAADQISIVGFATDVRDLLPPTSGARHDALRDVERELTAGGSTNLIGGLARGFELARSSRRSFDGVTRVIVMTDEQPNVGAVDDASFIGLARAASADGIGLTTFGIGTGLDARLTAAVSSVRGGNAVSFPSVDAVAPRLDEDFDLLFVELAYDLRVELVPTNGVRVTGVYGVPDAGVEWIDGGGIAMSVQTVFASRERGGIYVGLDAPSAAPDVLARATLTYVPRDGGPTTSARDVAVATGRLPVGLARGRALVDEATTVRAAIARHEAGDTAGALALVQALSSRLDRIRDADLEVERELVRDLAAALGGRGTVASRDVVTGLPR